VDNPPPYSESYVPTSTPPNFPSPLYKTAAPYVSFPAIPANSYSSSSPSEDEDDSCRPDFTPINLSACSDHGTVLNLSSRIVPGKENPFILESFGRVDNHRDPLASIQDNAGGQVLLLSQVARPYPIYRDVRSEQLDRAIKRAVIDLMEEHRNTFHHNTCSL
jgi:hypothetical protein